MPLETPTKSNRRAWFARVAGERLPCVHREWLVPPRHYLDPGAQPGAGKWDEFIAALRETKRAILACDTRGDNGGPRRDQDLQIFQIDNIEVTERGLEFEFIRAIAVLKRR